MSDKGRAVPGQGAMSASAGPVPLAHLDMSVADGLSEAQARAIWHAVAEARVGRFDALAMHAELVAAGYTPLEADSLVEEVLERLGGRQATEMDTGRRVGPGQAPPATGAGPRRSEDSQWLRKSYHPAGRVTKRQKIWPI
jgi:hypothetical protein